MSDYQFIDNSAEVRRRMQAAIPPILEAVGIHLEGEAKEELENSPRRVDTGLLRNSITHAISGEPAAISTYQNDGKDKHGNRVPVVSGSYSGTAPDDSPDKQAVYIGTNVEYGIYVHEGAQHMTANRFLKKAVEENKDQIKRYIKEGLENA